MSVRKALLMDAIWTSDDEHRSLCAMDLRHPAKQCGCKSKGGCGIRRGVRRNLVECPKGQTALREMRIERGEAEGVRGGFCRSSVRACQHAAKLPKGLFAALRNGFGIAGRHSRLGVLVSSFTIEQNKNIANGF